MPGSLRELWLELAGHQAAYNPGVATAGQNVVSDEDYNLYIKCAQIVRDYEKEATRADVKRDIQNVKSDLKLRTSWIDYLAKSERTQAITERQVLRMEQKSADSMNKALTKMTTTRGSAHSTLLMEAEGYKANGQSQNAWRNVMDESWGKISDIEQPAFFQEAVTRIGSGVNWNPNNGEVTFTGAAAGFTPDTQAQIKRAGRDAHIIGTNQQAARDAAVQLDADHQAWLTGWEASADKDMEARRTKARDYLYQRESLLAQGKGVKDQEQAANEKASLEDQLNQRDLAEQDLAMARERVFGPDANQTVQQKSNREKAMANEGFQFFAKMNDFDVGKVVSKQVESGKFHEDGTPIMETKTTYLPKVGDGWVLARYYLSSKRNLPPKLLGGPDYLVRVTVKSDPGMVAKLAHKAPDGTQQWVYQVDPDNPDIRTSISPGELAQMKVGEMPGLMGNANAVTGLKYIAYFDPAASPDQANVAARVYRLTPDAQKAYDRYLKAAARNKDKVGTDPDLQDRLMRQYNAIPFEYEAVTEADERTAAIQSIQQAGQAPIAMFDDNGLPTAYLDEESIGKGRFQGIEFVDEDDAAELTSLYGGKLVFTPDPPDATITRVGEMTAATRDQQVEHGVGSGTLVTANGEPVLIKGNTLTEDGYEILSPSKEYTLKDFTYQRAGKRVERQMEKIEEGEIEPDYPGDVETFGPIRVRDIRPQKMPRLLRAVAPTHLDSKLWGWVRRNKIAKEVAQGKTDALRQDFLAAEDGLYRAQDELADAQSFKRTQTVTINGKTYVQGDGNHLLSMTPKGVPVMGQRKVGPDGELGTEDDVVQRINVGDSGFLRHTTPERDQAAFLRLAKNAFNLDLMNTEDRAKLDIDSVISDAENIVGLREQAFEESKQEWYIDRGLDPDEEVPSIGSDQGRNPQPLVGMEGRRAMRTDTGAFIPRPGEEEVTPTGLVGLDEQYVDAAIKARDDYWKAGSDAKKIDTLQVDGAYIGQKLVEASIAPDQWTAKWELSDGSEVDVEYTYDPTTKSYSYKNPESGVDVTGVTSAALDADREKQALVARVEAGTAKRPAWFPQEDEDVAATAARVTSLLNTRRAQLGDKQVRSLVIAAKGMEPDQRARYLVSALGGDPDDPASVDETLNDSVYQALEAAGMNKRVLRQLKESAKTQQRVLLGAVPTPAEAEAAREVETAIPSGAPPVDLTEPTERVTGQVEEATEEAQRQQMITQIGLLTNTSIIAESEAVRAAASDVDVGRKAAGLDHLDPRDPEDRARLEEATTEESILLLSEHEAYPEILANRAALDTFIQTGEIPPDSTGLNIDPGVAERMKTLTPEERGQIVQGHQVEYFNRLPAAERYRYSEHREQEMREIQGGLEKGSNEWRALNADIQLLRQRRDKAERDLEAAGTPVEKPKADDVELPTPIKGMSPEEVAAEAAAADQFGEVSAEPEAEPEPEAVDPGDLSRGGAEQWVKEGEPHRYAYDRETDQFYYQEGGDGPFVPQTKPNRIEAIKALGEQELPEMGLDVPWTEEAKEAYKAKAAGKLDLDIFDEPDEEPEAMRLPERDEPRESWLATAMGGKKKIESPTPTAMAAAIAPGERGLPDPGRESQQRSMLSQALGGQIPSKPEEEQEAVSYG